MQYRVISRMRLFTAPLATALLLALSACQWDPSRPASTENPNPGGVAVDLEIRTAALGKGGAAAPPRPTDSTVVLVSAPDFPARAFGFGSGMTRFGLVDLTPGPNRRFQVQLLRQGKILYAGEAETTLYADRKNSLFLHCLPRFSRVTASVHVPLDFPKKISKGLFFLRGGGDSLGASLEKPGEFLVFKLEETPGDRDYFASLLLWDSVGVLLATGANPNLRVPMGENVSLEMPLLTAFAQLQVGIVVKDPKNTGLNFSFPAGRRAPSAFGEVVFSELSPAPAAEDSGSQGEWLEFFNRTSDTLNLDNCKLVRDGGGTSTKQAVFPAGTFLPPGKAFVAGHKYAPRTDFVLAYFSLPNSLSSMELSCRDGALKLDNLTYSLSPSDSSAIVARDGMVTTLRPGAITTRTNPASWCVVPSHPDSSGGATPGTLEEGCGG